MSRYNKITNLAHSVGEGEAKSGGNSVKLIQKFSFFQFCLPIFGIRRAIWSSENCKGSVLRFQGQIAEIPLISSGKLGLFLILALFLYPSLPKIGHSHPVKVIGIRPLAPVQNSVSLKLMQSKTLNFVVNLPDVENITK